MGTRVQSRHQVPKSILLPLLYEPPACRCDFPYANFYLSHSISMNDVPCAKNTAMFALSVVSGANHTTAAASLLVIFLSWVYFSTSGPFTSENGEGVEQRQEYITIEKRVSNGPMLCV